MSLSAASGVARLARFRADGLAAFDASPVGLLNALAPWLAFALVGGGLALAGGLVGIGNLQLAVFALRHSPVAFLGSSLPRLAVITVAMATLVVLLGPVGIWALLGLLVTHLAQVGAVLRMGARMSAR